MAAPAACQGVVRSAQGKCTRPGSKSMRCVLAVMVRKRGSRSERPPAAPYWRRYEQGQNISKTEVLAEAGRELGLPGAAAGLRTWLAGWAAQGFAGPKGHAALCRPARIAEQSSERAGWCRWREASKHNLLAKRCCHAAAAAAAAEDVAAYLAGEGGLEEVLQDDTAGKRE